MHVNFGHIHTDIWLTIQNKYTVNFPAGLWKAAPHLHDTT